MSIEPDEVRTEVRRRILDLAPGGGYITSAVHYIQPDVPPENVVAMCEAVKQFGKYPIAAISGSTVVGRTQEECSDEGNF